MHGFQIPAGHQTLVYSKVDGHEIKLDYWLPRNANGALPAVIYYHGGGMTAGSRRSFDFPHGMHSACQENGYIFISADYRLCHPCTALDQIDDVKALFQYLGGKFGMELPSGTSLALNRIAVTGSSAGAYSARVACLYAEPKPAVLMTAFGLAGDLLLDHWLTPRPATSLGQLVSLDKVPEFLADKTVVSDDQQFDFKKSRFALTARWELDGTMLDNIFGHPGLGKELLAVEKEQRGDAIPSKLKPAFPQLFVSKDYPPSVFVHGTLDEVVPKEESINQHRQLEYLGVKSKLLLVEGAGHSLIDPTSGFPPTMAKGADEAYETAFRFIVEVINSIQ
ncbi:hypothetical protein JX265_000800 [Neoarthrinium moseri]|uniref:Alpha/beta-hydrolase n=1 Tax=Neoarthrinium moseri TaxID=1658444 RepID=A0A9P9WWM4_9PEZI|nr:uncharacterized protein JN550_007094 [Neoarthrinium moseri]KAI1847549.1 hypothetical protein JX266_006401 [Neoarthrinium moseri]KAI1867363.1 hypothetical protein JN550_007094 [Neoarthrinium moseri]KAI1880560.1 hypothetical protein JX265_000800 [Neoarthrinium moseri]